MKSCPECNRTFEDTFTFCLIDGSVLSAPIDPHATLVIPEARQTTPPPTEVLKLEETKQQIPPTIASPKAEQKPQELASTIAAPAPAFEPAHIKAPPIRLARMSNKLAWFIIVGGSIFIVAFIFWVISDKSRDNQPKPANINIISPANR
jgi:hypothetical protein